VLVNDADLDGNDLSAVLDADVSNGLLFLVNDTGGFTYTPNSGFVGTDSFTYHATDGFANSATVTVTLQVGP
ncbi:MAG: cadherin-like domain-containing protein, partial [Gemmatimonadales bacterium]|nr:cadherin-like domain-containing protein [Gemmatimonadales bacterium]